MSNEWVLNFGAKDDGLTEVTGKVIHHINEISDKSGKLVRQLERQAAVLAMGKDAYNLYRIATSGASDATQAHAIHLQDFITKTQAAKTAVVALTAAQTASQQAQAKLFEPLTRPDHFGRGLDRMKAQSQIDADLKAAAAKRDASDPFLRGMSTWQGTQDSFQRGLRVNAENNSVDAAAAAERARLRGTSLPILDNSGQGYHRTAAGKGRDDQEKEQAEHSTNMDRIRAHDRDVRLKREADELSDTENYRKRVVSGHEEMERDSERAMAEGNARRSDIEAKRRDTERQNSRVLSAIMSDDVDEENVSRQLNEKRQLKGGSQHHNQEPRDSRGKWFGLEGFRAVEDFAQGSAYGGMRGGLLGASNNISQMGTALGAYGGMIGAAISTTIILGSTAYEAWKKSDESTRRASESVKEYTANISNVVSHFQSLAAIEMKRHDFGKGPDGPQSAATSESARRKEDREISAQEAALQKKKREEQKQNNALGLGDMTGEQLRDSMRRVAGQTRVYDESMWSKNIKPEVDPTTGERFQHKNFFTGETAQNEAERERDNRVRNANQNALTEEHAKELINIRKKNTQTQEEIDARKKMLAETKSHHDLLMDIERAKGQAEADFTEARRRSHEVGGAGPLAEWEQMDKERAFANAENQRTMDKFAGGQKWFQSRKEDLLMSRRDGESTWGSAAYRAQKEHDQSLRGSGDAFDRGIITDKQRRQLDAESEEKRDKAIREAKYGGLQADGQTGFQSADVKSSAGFNAILKSIQYSRQQGELDELKKHGDILADIRRATEDANTINKAGPQIAVF